MIVTVGQNKGGVGKTTLAMNLAIELQARGRNPVVVDADHVLKTARLWSDDRAGEGLPVIPVYTGEGSLLKLLETLSKTHDDVIVDVRGGDSTEMRTGLAASDLVVIPTSGMQNDLDSLEPLAKTVQQARDFNPDLVALVVLNRVSPQGMRYEVQDAREYISDYPELELSETIITTSKEWSRSRAEGKGVVEVRGKRKATMQLLTTEILTKAGEGQN